MTLLILSHPQDIRLELALCNPYGGVKTVSKEYFPYVK